VNEECVNCMFHDIGARNRRHKSTPQIRYLVRLSCTSGTDFVLYQIMASIRTLQHSSPRLVGLTAALCHSGYQQHIQRSIQESKMTSVNKRTITLSDSRDVTDIISHLQRGICPSLQQASLSCSIADPEVRMRMGLPGGAGLKHESPADHL